ncbi:DNA alkylation repair protein [Streptomyces sp. SL13]|uniref:DNA alkylation repair protein n=1 Tax=Streptantibioticus silvisoli TaxID=2705255 RepID=A0AA90GTF6_9ACTN|nr:DNA alkylation repair protein [Streptantibioticus silvisoli]MDI5967758.1 DNA alkylation repair protein [Streptantibioticus silvisoli]
MPTADELLSAATVRTLRDSVALAAPGSTPTALRHATGALDGLGLAERVRLVRDATLADLPADWPGFAGVVRTALEQEAFSGWLIWPVGEAVADRALSSGRTADFDAGLELLTALTPRLTCEFAIRSFLAADLDRTLAAVRSWTGRPDAAVRRLASEGTRPRLPWGRRVRGLLERPGVTLPVLDALYRDPSEDVRRSVANHLNDVSHATPALATDAAARWTAAPDAHTPALVRRALRTLIKQGDPAALLAQGFGPPDDIEVTGPVLAADVVEHGGTLSFEATLRNGGTRPVTLAVDYVVHHRKANGTTTPKVFKLTTRTLAPGAATTVGRTHSFRPITTRVHHPGEHALELQVNGVRSGRRAFLLTGPADPATG